MTSLLFAQGPGWGVPGFVIVLMLLAVLVGIVLELVVPLLLWLAFFRDPKRLRRVWLNVYAGLQLALAVMVLVFWFLAGNLPKPYHYVSIPRSSLLSVVLFLVMAWGIGFRRRWALAAQVAALVIPIATFWLVRQIVTITGGLNVISDWLALVLLVLGPLYVWNVLFGLRLASMFVRRVQVDRWTVIAELAIITTVLLGAFGVDSYQAIQKGQVRMALQQKMQQDYQAYLRFDREAEAFVAAALAGDLRALAEARSRLTPGAKERLKDQIHNADPRVRREVARIVGFQAVNHVALLTEILSDCEEPPDFRLQAVRTGLEFGSRGPREDYRRFIDALIAVENEESLGIISVVAESIGQKAQQQPMAVSLVSPEAIDFLAEMGPKAEPAVPALIQCLHHTNQWDVVPAAARALGAIGQAAEPAVPALIQCLEHPNQWNMIMEAARALGEIGPAAGPAVPALVKMTAENRSVDLSEVARDALIKIQGTWGLTISGRVTEPQGEPLENAEVKTVQLEYGKHFEEATVRTGPEGKFVLPTVPLGVSVRLEARHFENKRFGTIDVVPTVEGRELVWSREVALTAYPTATVKGLALVDGRPTAEVQVRVSSLLPGGGQQPIGECRTDQDGKFEIHMVPAGGISVHASYRSSEFSYASRGLQVEGEKSYDLEPLHVYAKNMSVSGIVVDHENRPISGVLVVAQARDPDQRQWLMPDALTGTDGRFTIDRIPNVPLVILAFPNPDPPLIGYSSAPGRPNLRDPDRVVLAAKPGQVDVRVVIAERKQSNSFNSPRP